MSWNTIEIMVFIFFVLGYFKPNMKFMKECIRENKQSKKNDSIYPKKVKSYWLICLKIPYGWILTYPGGWISTSFWRPTWLRQCWLKGSVPAPSETKYLTYIPLKFHRPMYIVQWYTQGRRKKRSIDIGWSAFLSWDKSPKQIFRGKRRP